MLCVRSSDRSFAAVLNTSVYKIKHDSNTMYHVYEVRRSCKDQVCWGSARPAERHTCDSTMMRDVGLLKGNFMCAMLAKVEGDWR
jgi:hypothetical protein